MCKIFIKSKDQGYAQYLKSLVQQIPADPELDVHYVFGPENWSDDEDEPGLLVVYQSSDRETIEPLMQIRSWDQTIWISYSSAQHSLPASDSKNVWFTRPINCLDFVHCVYQWCKNKHEHCSTLKQAPAEPFLVGNSQAIRLLRQNINRISQYDLEVLICGATGTGKGVVAQSLHNNSPRSGQQFLTINCANLPTNLMESELFGYRRGAFTGAWADKSGKLEMAKEGTILLDEISEISTSMQAKLLQVLQEKEFCPIGGVDSVQIKSRVVAATNADLERAIARGAFRKDLYYRLAVVCLEVPPLKNRKEDVPVLVHHFLDKYSRIYDKQEVPHLSEAFWDLLLAHDWPGNVRELENCIKSLVALGNEELVREELGSKIVINPAAGNNGQLLAGGISPGLSQNPKQEPFLQQMSLPQIVEHTTSRIEAMLICKALEQTGAKKKAAQVLGISYKSLLNKIKSYGL